MDESFTEPAAAAPASSAAMGSGGARLIATANPLQLKMEQMKRDAEERAKKEAKKASMASRLAAFQKPGGSSAGGGGGAGSESATTTPTEAEPSPGAAPAKRPEIDSRVTAMANSA